MSSIGFVTKQSNGGYKGFLKTLKLKADIDIVPNNNKTHADQPDFRVLSRGFELGAGWTKVGKTSEKPYVSLSLAAPEFGAKKLYANLGRAADQSDDDAYAIIWNPAE